MPDAVRFVPDGAGFAAIMRGPNGPAARDLIRRGDMVIAGAKVMLAPHSRTGQLSKEIVKRFRSFEPLTMEVVAMAPYAFWVHEGNGPQGGRIYPTNGKFLRFIGQAGRGGQLGPGGAVIFARSVKTVGE